MRTYIGRCTYTRGRREEDEPLLGVCGCTVGRPCVVQVPDQFKLVKTLNLLGLVNPHGGYSLAPAVVVDPPIVESSNDDASPRDDPFLATLLRDTFVGTQRSTFMGTQNTFMGTQSTFMGTVRDPLVATQDVSPPEDHAAAASRVSWAGVADDKQ